MKYGSELSSQQTPIPGLLLFDLPVHGDSRGWFKENWQRQKMLAHELPDFGPVQNNVSFNSHRGTTRGIHAEPWDKFISVATGSVFAAWVDLREGASFGTVFTTTLDPSKAIFVPRGVANSFQTLEDGTVYTYLVNDHWSADAQSLYTFVNLADPTLRIQWPIPLDQSTISDKDAQHPMLIDVAPMKSKRTLVLGSNGQLGTALRNLAKSANFSSWDFADRSTIDLYDTESLRAVAWSDYETVINAAAFTNVDEAESAQGRKDAWAVNAEAVAEIAQHCDTNRVTLVHLSTDYVFDGTMAPIDDDESLSPLGVYGQSKAAGEIAARASRRHYILRTSWVIGDGNNFIDTMVKLARKGIQPQVVNDQTGRMTFADDLALAIVNILSSSAPFGTYNVSNFGEPASWHQIAVRVFQALGYPSSSVQGVSTSEYYATHTDRLIAPRPQNSSFRLEKLKGAGIDMRDQWIALDDYLARHV